jgi:hypothetical protein
LHSALCTADCESPRFWHRKDGASIICTEHRQMHGLTIGLATEQDQAIVAHLAALISASQLSKSTQLGLKLCPGGIKASHAALKSAKICR